MLNEGREGRGTIESAAEEERQGQEKDLILETQTKALELNQKQQKQK